MRSPSVDMDGGEEAPGLATGSILAGKYRIEALLGRGGMGAVYRAQHVLTGRRVAVKTLLADHESARRRFLQEARAMGALQHPNVVGVLDVGEQGGAVFLVMEFFEGRNLREHVGRRPVAPAEAIALLMPALEGVAAAHQAGFVHRDLKPENLLVCVERDGTAYDTKVLDFGVARSLRRRDDDGLTKTGAVVGTPRYMSPEQVLARRDLDPRVDVFALGLILYELLTGRLPYTADTYEALVVEIATRAPESPRTFRPELPEELAAIVLRALAKEREARFDDVASFAVALEPFAPGVRFRPPRAAHVRMSSVPPAADAPFAETQDARPSADPAPNPRERPSNVPTALGRPATPAVRDARAPSGAETPLEAIPATRVEPTPEAVASVLPVRRTRARVVPVAVVAALVGIAALGMYAASPGDTPRGDATAAAPPTAPPSSAGAPGAGLDVPPPAAIPTSTAPAPALAVAAADRPDAGALPLGRDAREVAGEARSARPRVVRTTRSRPRPSAGGGESAPGMEARGRAGVLRSNDF